jgi:hypothetical protein
MDLVFGAHTARARIPRPCTLALAKMFFIVLQSIIDIFHATKSGDVKEHVDSEA